MLKEHLHNMSKHMAWADRRIQGALESTGGNPVEALRLFGHVLAAEHNWLKRMEDKAQETGPVFPEWGLNECAEMSVNNAEGYERLLQSVSEAGLQRDMEYRTSDGTPYRNAMADMLTQVFMHGSYHRGQINARLRGAGFTPINVDFITFVRQQG